MAAVGQKLTLGELVGQVTGVLKIQVKWPRWIYLMCFKLIIDDCILSPGALL